ncbi:TPA: hypothetical protein ACN7R5_005113, partial [Klebsiella pneumoniae]
MAFNPELGSTSPAVLLDNAERLDKLVNGPELTEPDRAGVELDTWRGMMAKNDEIRQNLIPLSKQYMTLAAAQADIANIPDGATTYIRSTDGSSLADEYINNGGTLQATGRQMPSQRFVEELAGNFFTALSVIDNAVNNCGLNIDNAVKNCDLITNALKNTSEKRASENYTAIAVVVNTLENLCILLDKNYTTIPSMNEDRLNLLMLSSRLLKILEGLDGFDPNAVLTRADIDEVGGGEYETIAGIFSYPEPTSLITIDLTADKIPASKAEGDVNATAVITLDGSVFSSRCKISVQGA